ncbi:MAG: TRAP transporter small permease [Hyphomicrobiales bacterium]|nr:MAG: TRAP transporter small permease [Hyphomicrobiales bacterium]
MKTFETIVSRVSLLFAAFVLLAMMLQVVADVFLRSFIGDGVPATAEIVARYYMVSISFLPLAMTEIGRRHIEATIFTDGLNGPMRKVVALGGFLIGLAVFGVLAWGSAQEALRQTARSSYVEVGTMYFSTWPSFWIPPVSFALMEVILLVRLIEVLTGRFELHAHDPLEEIDSHAGEAS